MNENIRILIVDDHPVVRYGLQGMLNSKPGLEVVGEAEDGIEAVLQASALKPDVILLDLIMPQADGLSAIKKIKQKSPKSRILVLTSMTEEGKLFAALEAGALGCMLKDSSPQELVRAIRDVHQGKLSLHPTVARKLLRRETQSREAQPAGDSLTEREIEVVKLLAKGLSNREIAQELTVTEQTIRGHITNILSKLQMNNRTQVVLFALRTGIAQLNP